MKKIIFFFSILMLSATLSHAQLRISADIIMGHRQPNPSERQMMQVEESRYPNIAKAMFDVQNALQALRNAPDAFGGYKGQAEIDLQKAWVSLRKALYFRIYKER
jgi:hypothetical protein